MRHCFIDITWNRWYSPWWQWWQWFVMTMTAMMTIFMMILWHRPGIRANGDLKTTAFCHDALLLIRGVYDHLWQKTQLWAFGRVTTWSWIWTPWNFAGFHLFICIYMYIYIYIHIHCFTRLCFALPRSPNDQLDHSWWFSATPGPTWCFRKLLLKKAQEQPGIRHAATVLGTWGFPSHTVNG